MEWPVLRVNDFPDWALMLIGLAGMYRWSELTSRNISGMQFMREELITLQADKFWQTNSLAHRVPGEIL